MEENKYPQIGCPHILIKFGTQDEHKCMLRTFCVFSHKAQKNACFVCGREAVSIHILHIYGIIWWNSIWKFCTYCW